MPVRRSTPLAPIVVTQEFPRVVGGDAANLTTSKEVWGARTVDGAWEMTREELPGTPWQVIRVADRRSGGWYGTLRECRAAIASGLAAREANRCRACEGNGLEYEWRAGREHNRGFVGYRRLQDGTVEYRHLVGPCPHCEGSGREPQAGAVAGPGPEALGAAA